MTIVRPWLVCAVAVSTVLGAATAGTQESDRAAVEGSIAAHLAKGDISGALSSYDAFVSSIKKPDLELVHPIALAELKRLARSYPQDPVIYPGALERLALAGDSEALQGLRRAGGASSSPLGVGSLASLARLHDDGAERRLGDLLKSAPPESKIRLIEAIEAADARSQGAAVAALLNDGDVNVRRVAARTVGVLQHREAIPQLRAMMERDAPIVRMFAGPALKRMGDTSADAWVSKMLAGDAPEMRLEAARAFPRSGRAPWVERVKELRGNRDIVARVRAAEVLACCDPAVSRAILDEALADPLPPVRVEAARVYELAELADAAVARRLLGDSFDHVRLYGAGTVVRQVATLRAKKK